MKTDIINLRSSSLNLELCPSFGGSITRFDFISGNTVVPLLRPYDVTKELSVLNFASFPLTPFSNRIDSGELLFQGASFRVGPSFANEQHPNHGDGWTSSWSARNVTESCATLFLKTKASSETPYIYEAKQIFQLDDDTLTIGLEMTNLSGKALPFGTGHHFYYPRTQKTQLKVHLPQVWTSHNMMPESLITVPKQWDFSDGLILSDDHLKPAQHGGDGSAFIDHCFQGWDQQAEIFWPETGMHLSLHADPVFENFVIYIPQAEFFCAEPVTNITNGFNLMEKGVQKTGTIILDHGQTLSGRVRLKASHNFIP